MRLCHQNASMAAPSWGLDWGVWGCVHACTVFLYTKATTITHTTENQVLCMSLAVCEHGKSFF